MGHPFFDTLTYPWCRKPQADDLHQVLYQAFRNPVQIDLMYQRCGADLPPLALGHAPDEIWKEALEKLTKVGALRELCDSLRQELAFQKSEKFRNAVQAIFDAQPAYKVHVVSGYLPVPVLDRETLRDKLRQLDNDDHPMKVLLVRGGRDSGKSHSRFLFEQAARDRGAVSVYLEAGQIVTVKDVIDYIFIALEAAKEVPPCDTSEDAWYRAVCRKMLEVALRDRRALWIAVDDLGVGLDGTPLLDTSIRKFCEQVAMSMVNPPFRERFRLMLIDYPPGDVPIKWKRDFWDQDFTAVTDVQAKHVSELLMWWARERHMTLLADDLQRSTQEVISAGAAAPAADNRPPLRRIYDALVGVLNKI